jgi:hypothetical protein
MHLSQSTAYCHFRSKIVIKSKIKDLSFQVSFKEMQYWDWTKDKLISFVFQLKFCRYYGNWQRLFRDSIIIFIKSLATNFNPEEIRRTLSWIFPYGYGIGTKKKYCNQRCNDYLLKSIRAVLWHWIRSSLNLTTL